MIHKGRLPKMSNLDFWLKLGGGVQMGFRSPTCNKVIFLMLKNGLKLKYYLITRPKLGGGGGVSGGSAKSPSLTFFLEAFPKYNNCEYQTPYKANYRRHVKNKHSNYKASMNGAECNKRLQAANIGHCPGIETLRLFSYSSVEKLSKF